MADDFTQANRRLRIETPLGPDALLITALSGTEGVSSLFRFEAELLGRDENADFDSIVGANVTVSIAAGGGPRFVNGIVSRFSQSGTVRRSPHLPRRDRPLALVPHPHRRLPHLPAASRCPTS